MFGRVIDSSCSMINSLKRQTPTAPDGLGEVGKEQCLHRQFFMNFLLLVSFVEKIHSETFHAQTCCR